ncbi:glycosyltransferase family 4 protein [Ravibacter arvi]|uniref:Glycosyltransferase family 4 protein n=1 Tax=Ravibacter arvi TaxID=2051041 RepID=A0ABP8MAV9_9BACT
MQEKTLVFVGNTSWGMYNFREKTLRKLKESGYRVVVLAPEDHFSERLRQIPVEFIPLGYLKGSGTNPLTDYQLYRELKAHYESLKPEIVFHYTVKPNIYGSLAARALKIRNVAFVTGLGYAFMRRNLVAWLIRRMYNISLRKADQVWFLNQDDIADFKKEGIRAGNKTVIVNGEGIDTRFFAPAPVTYQVPVTRFLMAARMLGSKGVSEFVAAIGTLKKENFNVKGVLLGPVDGDNKDAISRADLENWENEGAITYLGETTDVRSFIADAHCVVLPSYREGIPRVLLEAGAMERPCITTRVPGCKEVITHGFNGFLCEPQDSADLARQMIAFIRLTEAQKLEMAQNARKNILARFDQPRVDRHYLDAIGELLLR